MTLLRRTVCVLLAILLALPFAAGVLTTPASAAGSDVTINVYNWGQYISDGTDGYIDVNAAFTEATGIKVNYMTFDTNESLYTKLKTGGSTYDIIIPSDYMAGRLIAEGLVQEIDFGNIPNYAYIDEAYKNTAYDPDNRYSVPYTWGTTGVIYNTKYVDPADIGGWDLLWNSKYAGKILMFDNNRDAFAIAESSLGYSLNTTSESELRACSELLAHQKPVIQQYVMDQIYDKMIGEEAWIAPYYAGDFLVMQEENEDLEFYFPEEGFNLFIDCMMIPPTSISCWIPPSAAKIWTIWAIPPRKPPPRNTWIRRWWKTRLPTPARKRWPIPSPSCICLRRRTSSWIRCGWRSRPAAAAPPGCW